jgi:NTP pyrophosphatase (non-canonical NTP hydrolase)
MNPWEQLQQINVALDRRFPDGRNPYQIMTRLAEECGELAREVNHFEGSGVKADKHGAPDPAHLAKEAQDVLRCALQIVAYYGLQDELEQSIAASYEQARREGLIE